MLPADRLTLSIEIQERAYKLLQWVSGAIGKGFIPTSRAHEYASAGESALDWIERHYQNFPADARPERIHLVPFANFFATYLTTSFDILEQPGSLVYSPCGCYCPFCSYVMRAPHLRTKKPTARDKTRAQKLKAERAIALAIEEGRALSLDAAQGIASGPETHRAAAYSTYGHWLIKRTEGISDGKSVLALWREIAWHPAGSPIKNFKLRFEDFADAEELLLAAMSRP